jgi:hypothetical protein
MVVTADPRGRSKTMTAPRVDLKAAHASGSGNDERRPDTAAAERVDCRSIIATVDSG